MTFHSKEIISYMFYFLFFWGVFEIWVWRRDRGRIVRWGRRAELELAEDSWIVRQYGYAAPVAVRACPGLWPSCPPPLFFFPWNYGFILHFWTHMTLSPSFLMRGRESGNEKGGWKNKETRGWIYTDKETMNFATVGSKISYGNHWPRIWSKGHPDQRGRPT